MAFQVEQVQKLDCSSCGHEFDPSAHPPLKTIECPSCGGDVRVPARFDKFLLYKRLGSGAMGVVFEAEDPSLKRALALKVLKSGRDSDQIAAEARLLASLNHHNIVRLYGMGEFRDQFYLALELVTGGSAKDLITREGHQSDQLEVIEMAIAVTEGLRAAQKVGLVHTDVKPGSILLDSKRRPKLTDFGAAYYRGPLSEDDAVVVDSHYYVAPEVVRESKADFRSDMYSLGTSLYHILAGRPPFIGHTAKEIMQARRYGRPPSILSMRPDVDAKVLEVIVKLLMPDPAARYASYDELITALHGARQAVAAKGGAAATILTRSEVIRASAASTGSVTNQEDEADEDGGTRFVFEFPKRIAVVVCLAVAAVVFWMVLGPGSSFWDETDPNTNSLASSGSGPIIDINIRGPKNDQDGKKKPKQDKSKTKSANPGNRPQGSRRGLVRHWPLNKQSGTSPREISGKGRKGIFKNMKASNWVAETPLQSKYTGSIRFDGVNDWVETGFRTNLPKWTITAWVRGDDAPKDRSAAGPVYRADNFYMTWDHGERKNRGVVGLKIGKVWHEASFGPLEGKRWYHLAGTYDGKVLRSYKDGKLINSNSKPNGPPNKEKAALAIGMHAASKGYFKGWVQDVRIYRYAFTARRMHILANTKKYERSKPASLVGSKGEI